MDCVPQRLNIEDDLYEYGVNISLYVPFYYVTTGLMWMMKILTTAQDDKNNLSEDCSRICKVYDKFVKKNISGLYIF